MNPATTASRRPRLVALIRRAFGDESGATAVEFGILALPFIGLLVAIFETCAMFLAQEVLQTATSRAARLIMTGQAQTQSLTPEQFRQTVCTEASGLFDCSGVHVHVQRFASFTGVTPLNPIDDGQFDPDAVRFAAGGPGDIVAVQVFYKWPISMGPMDLHFSTLADGTRLLVGTAVFKNEPYQ